MSVVKIFIIVLLLVLPGLSVFYKTEVEQVSFIPKESSDSWAVEVSYNMKNIFDDRESVRLPRLNSSYLLEVDEENVYPHFEIEEAKHSQREGYVLEKETHKAPTYTFKYKVRFLESFRGQRMNLPATQNELLKSEEEYLSLEGVPDEILKELKSLNQKLLIRGESSNEVLRKIYFYLTEEILVDESVDDLDKVLELREGSEMAKAYLSVFLARLNDIPARVAFGLRIESRERSETNYEVSPVFIPETLDGDSWRPLNINQVTYKRLSNKTFILHHDMDQVKESLTSESFDVKAAPVFLNEVDSKLYSEKLEQVSPFLASLSLHRLPLSMRYIFYSILLIPLGTLVLAFSRNVIGLQSFGIFTPILLGLFFIETSFMTGLFFLSVVVLLGYIQRYFLEKFYLLAVPRLSILLTSVIIIYTLFTLYSYQGQSFLLSPQGSLGYFPIVIMTILIERFSVLVAEEGFKNTLKTLVGTVLIAFLCYLVLMNEYLRLAVFNHPELLLSVISLNLIMGSYKGYRLSELLRFKKFQGKPDA